MAPLRAPVTNLDGGCDRLNIGVATVNAIATLLHDLKGRY